MSHHIRYYDEGSAEDHLQVEYDNPASMRQWRFRIHQDQQFTILISEY